MGLLISLNYRLFHLQIYLDEEAAFCQIHWYTYYTTNMRTSWDLNAHNSCKYLRYTYTTFINIPLQFIHHLANSNPRMNWKKQYYVHNWHIIMWCEWVLNEGQCTVNSFPCAGKHRLTRMSNCFTYIWPLLHFVLKINFMMSLVLGTKLYSIMLYYLVIAEKRN